MFKIPFDLLTENSKLTSFAYVFQGFAYDATTSKSLRISYGKPALGICNDSDMSAVVKPEALANARWKAELTGRFE